MTLKRIASVAAGALLAFAASHPHSAELNLSDRPLFLTEGVDPNFFITLDNSTSMERGYSPDEVDPPRPPTGVVLRDYRRAKSSAFNRIYYDPNVTYLPPLRADGSEFPQAVFNAAAKDAFSEACRDLGGGSVPAGCEVANLELDYAAQWFRSLAGLDPEPPADGTRPAYYYLFDRTLPGCTATAKDPDFEDCVLRIGDAYLCDDGCYRRVDVADPSFDRDNFANWYSYYRTRLLLTQTAVSRVLATADQNTRVGYQAINAAGQANDNQYLLPLPFTITQRNAVYDWLFGLATAVQTPLNSATRRVGEYLGTDPPFRQDPLDSGSSLATCRPNLHLLFTDGGWDDAAPSSNTDGTTGIGLPTPADSNALRPGSSTYTAAPPYADNRLGLADLAFEYWITDLRPTDPNNVPTYIRKRHLTGSGMLDRDATFWDPENDPADWQHLVNYSIGMGVAGLIESGLDGFPFEDIDARDRALFEALAAGSVSWDDGNKIDDLWHMAINSRGKYFSAQNPTELERALAAIIPPPLPTSIGGGQTVAQSSGSLTTESALYQATFSTTAWTGRVRALAICAGSNPDAPSSPTNCDPRGAIADQPLWDTLDTLGEEPIPSGRLFTVDPASGDGIDLQGYGDLSAAQQDLLRTDAGSLATRLAYLRGEWTEGDADLDADQQALLDDRDGLGTERLDFLRGSVDGELRNGGSFRDRIELSPVGSAVGNRLGDILNSPPLYVGPPRRFYPDALESAAYSDFRDGSDRQAMVYVGANDGMLHALDAATGEEVFAYIPSPVFPNLYRLTAPSYSHQGYVDGPLNEGDAFVADGGWRTFLAGALGLGGQGVFLLDVTDPAAVSEDDLVQWEFTDADDPDLGFTYGRPEIIKRADGGAWAVAFGNGYNNTYPDGRASTTGAAVLHVVNIADKASRLKISTGRGSADDPTGAGRPNGIAFVTPVDKDADFDTDYVYGGDLFGNLWRFDLVDQTATRVFTARDRDGNAQPITTAVRLARHPTGRGFLVLFGTGKYIEGGSVDTGNTDPQTFYGIWDDLTNAVEISRNALLEQEILVGNVQVAGTGEDASLAYEVRGVTNRSINWAVDPTTPPSDGQHLGWFIDLPEPGERVHQAPVVRGDRVVFVTVTPEDDPCSAGGSSWLMEVEWKDGSSLEMISPFDFLQTGAFEVLTVSRGGIGDTPPSEVSYGAGLRAPATGVYSAPAAMVISMPEERKYIHTSRSELIEVGESTNLGRFRAWREIR